MHANVFYFLCAFSLFVFSVFVSQFSHKFHVNTTVDLCAALQQQPTLAVHVMIKYTGKLVLPSSLACKDA